MGTVFSMSPGEAIQRVKDGNERFLSGQKKYGSGTGKERLTELTGGQAPYATILSCSDSRVPPEHIFDAGFGDLFICRNAGNIIDEVTLGSIEYAAAHTGCPLLIVMGHENCGACGATIAHYKDPHHYETHNVDDIVRRIMPAVVEMKQFIADQNFVNQVVLSNVKNVCRQVVQRSTLLKGFIEKGEYKIIGAYYQLSTGKVSFVS